jgi:hypothetical protein
VPNEARRAHSRRFCRPTLSRPDLARRRLGHALEWCRGYADIRLFCDRDVTQPLTSRLCAECRVPGKSLPEGRHGYDDAIVSPMKIPCPRRRAFGGKHEQFCGGRAHRRVSAEYAARSGSHARHEYLTAGLGRSPPAPPVCGDVRRARIGAQVLGEPPIDCCAIRRAPARGEARRP